MGKSESKPAGVALPSTAVVAIIGAGTMGAGIAQLSAHAAHPVLLWTPFGRGGKPRRAGRSSPGWPPRAR